jgi:hypothetical protein
MNIETQIEHNENFTQLLFSHNVEKPSSQTFTLFPISLHQNDYLRTLKAGKFCSLSRKNSDSIPSLFHFIFSLALFFKFQRIKQYKVCLKYLHVCVIIR